MNASEMLSLQIGDIIRDEDAHGPAVVVVGNDGSTIAAVRTYQIPIRSESSWSIVARGGYSKLPSDSIHKRNSKHRKW